MDRFLRLDIKNWTLERYRNLIDIPFKPAETIPIKFIKEIEFRINNKDNRKGEFFIFENNKD